MIMHGSSRLLRIFRPYLSPRSAPHQQTGRDADESHRDRLAGPGLPDHRSQRLERSASLSEAEGLAMLADYGIPVVSHGTACGLAGGLDLPTTVMPFILRGVRLQGVDSVMAPVELRVRAWERLASELNFDLLHSMMTEVPMSDLLNLAPKILAGQIRGRIVVNTHA
jgi:acrylyl-CoA reductase (NADPH)